MAKRSQTKLNRTNNNTYIFVWCISIDDIDWVLSECSVCERASSARTLGMWVGMVLLLLLLHIQFHTQCGIHTLSAMPCCSVCIYTRSVCLPMVHFCVILVPSLSCPHLFLTTSISVTLLLLLFPECARIRSRSLKAKKEHEYHSSSNNNNSKENEPYKIKLKCVCYIRSYAKRMDGWAGGHAHA